MAASPPKQRGLGGSVTVTADPRRVIEPPPWLGPTWPGRHDDCDGNFPRLGAGRRNRRHSHHAVVPPMNPKQSRQATENAMMDTNTTDKWDWIGWFLLGALAALALLIILFGGWVIVK